MVNFKDPYTIVQDAKALVNLHHAVTGIFIWECFTTFDFEWDVIRGRRPYRRTIWVYSLARAATLLAMANELIGIDTTTRIECQASPHPTFGSLYRPVNCDAKAWGTFGLVLPNTAFAAATLLIVFRIMAIWYTENIVILIAWGVWLVDVVFLINGVVRARISWSVKRNACVLLNPQTLKPNITGSLIADVVLLLIMLIGLVRLQFRTGDGSGLERVLWRQGLIWLLVAILFEIPSTVLVCLDLNEPMSYIFQTPNLATMTITATRMYRSLMDLGPSGLVVQESCSGSLSVGTISKLRARTEPIPLSEMKSACTEINRHPSSKSQMAGSGSLISTDLHGP